MASFLLKIRNFFQPLNGAQKTLFVLFSAGLLLIIGLMFYWVLKPNYAMLFGSLPPESAQEIVEELQSMGVHYELQDNGRTIHVERERVYDLRLQFAAEGMTGSDYQGYELFDQNSLGMTDFMQRLNQKRALEGELARTINSLAQVESSRIHIVLPERSPFQETSVEPSASVIVNLGRGQSLDKSQIEGIGALIGGSVEGLDIEDVVILDQMGNRISENVLVNEDVAASSTQIKVRRDMETYLTEKAQSMLDRVLGPGNSIVRVSTEHNFDRLVRESELVDPESRVLISEESRSSSNADETREAIQGQDEVEPFVSNIREDESDVQVRNYEVNRIQEQEERVVGAITRISASLLLNHKQVETGAEGESTTEFVPYSDEEIDEISTIISSTLGILEERGDEISVTQVRFQDPFINDTGTETWIQTIPMSEVIRYVFLAIVMSVISWMVYRISKNFSVEYDSLLADPQTSGEQLTGMNESKFLKESSMDDENDLYKQKLSEEAKRKMHLASTRNNEISKFMIENAHEAAGIVRTMINQRTAEDM